MRSTRSLIQTCGRASRNSRGKVIMYADTVTAAMRQAIAETQRRRKIQDRYNRRHHITPTTVRKEIQPVFGMNVPAESGADETIAETVAAYVSMDDLEQSVKQMEAQMHQAARDLEFERAAEIRDRIRAMKARIVLAQ